MNRDEKEEITDQLRDILSSSIGMPVVFSLAECVKEYLEQPRFSEKNKSVPEPDVFEIEESVPKFAQKLSSIQCPAITTGDCIEDRKSVFQGHFAHVETVDEVKAVIAKLYENRKIANAVHNMYAYRIKQAGGNFFLK